METQMIQHITQGDQKALKDAFMAYFPVLYRQAWELGVANPVESVMDTFRAYWVGDIKTHDSLLDALSTHLPSLAGASDPVHHQYAQQLLQAVLQLPPEQRAYVDQFYFTKGDLSTEQVPPWQELGATLWSLSGQNKPVPKLADLIAKYQLGQADFDEASTLRHWVDEAPVHTDAFEALFQVHDTLIALPESVRPETFWPAFEASLPSSPSEGAPAKAVSRFSLRVAMAMMIGLLLVALFVWLGWFG